MGTETATEGGPPDACFDCNICLDSAAEPVVTLCGHLYCWPCIYQWLGVYPNPASGECPVCKAAVSLDALVPLYGRGLPCKARPANPIPRRPPARFRDAASTAVRRRRIPFEDDGYYPYDEYYGYPVLSSRAAGGLIGGLSFSVIGGGRRTRRREMWVADSLHQLWFFLVCCTLGCLFFF